MEKREHSCTVGVNVNWYSHYGRQYGDSFKKLRITSPYDPAIPLLGIYSAETKIEKDTRIPLFIAALFTIVKRWKQPRCLLTDEWIKKLWYIYTMEYSVQFSSVAQSCPTLWPRELQHARPPCPSPTPGGAQWILLSHKKEHVWVSSDEVDEHRTYCTEWSESEKER